MRRNPLRRYRRPCERLRARVAERDASREPGCQPAWPTAAARLTALGASVIKVEPPSGDPLAQYHPAYYQALAAGQQVVRLDLKSPAELARLDTLLAAADGLITATRPAALVRVGLDWPALHDRCPRLCQVAIVGYSPPRENEPGHDLTYQAESGLLSPPQLPRALLADLVGAEQAVTGLLALLHARDRGQEAGYLQVALSTAAQAMAQPLRYGITRPGALLGGGFPGYNLYETRDGWIALAALEAHFQQRLAAALGTALDREQLALRFKTKTAAEWQAWARAHDLPVVALSSASI